MKKAIYIAIVLLLGTGVSYCEESAFDSLKNLAQPSLTDEIVIPDANKSRVIDNSIEQVNKSKFLFSKLKISAFEGKVIAFEGVNLAQENLSLNVEWYCVKPDFFSTTGWQDCGKKYQGTQSVKIDGTGNFSFPKINSKGPFRGVFVAGISLNQNDKVLQGLGSYGGKGYFANSDQVSQIENDLKNLNITLIKGGLYSANIIVKEAGQPNIGFEEINNRYPNSYNQTISAKLSFTYDKVADQARTNPWHTTFARTLKGTYEQGKISFPDQLWAIKGFKSGTSVEVDLSFDVGIYLMKDGGTYKETKIRKNMTINSAQEVQLPSLLTGNLSEVVLSLD